MKSELHIRTVGLSAFLIELDSKNSVLPLCQYLAAGQKSGALPIPADIVPGARTVLLDGQSTGLSLSLLNQFLEGWAGNDPIAETQPQVIEVPVQYDGADLAEVARLTGMSKQAVIALHVRAPMTVAFCGFTPGFAYIGGLPKSLRLPRLTVPRTAVPAGAVAIGEEYTGIYPRPSPGGWRILGHTQVELWNIEWPSPALLSPGTVVQFIALPEIGQ